MLIVVLCRRQSIFCAIGAARTINYNMNLIWTISVVISFVVLTITSPSSVLPLAVDAGTRAVKCAVELVAVYAVWLGVFSVAEQCNAVQKLANLLGKVNRFLYGAISPEASKNVSLNMASNLLGIGNAATPSAIAAIKELEKGETLSRSGAMLFVLNACGIQLVPTTVVGLRASVGSQNASSVLLPTFIVTVITAVIGVLFVNIAYGRAKR